MKRIATVFFLLPLIIMAETLSLEKSAWRGNPLTWQAVPGGFKTIATGHTLEYVNAPLSENAEVEAVVTVEQRLQVSYSISAVALVQNASNFYHLALAVAAVPQELDGYEAEEGYTLRWVDPKAAIQENKALTSIYKRKYHTMLLREAMVLEHLLAEGLL